MYWETSADVHNEAISGSRTAHRFKEMMRFLHLANNEELDQQDKLPKVRNFLDALNERILENLPVTQDLSIDESMIPYYGRQTAKQFIRGNLICFGYKMWCLATPLGYLFHF